MQEVLEVINAQMQAIGVQYYDMTNTSAKVTYPYATGEFTQSGFDYETMQNQGDLLLDLWTRNERLELVGLCDKLQKHFSNFMTEKKGVIVHIEYAGSTPLRTNDNTLKRLQVNLNVTWWKGV